MTAALAAFERHLAVERDLSAHTVRAYLGDVTSLLAHAARLGREDPAQLDLRTLRSWLANQQVTGRSRTTLARRATAARVFTAWLARTGRAPADHGATLGSPKHLRTLPPVLRADEADRLVRDAVEAADDGSPLGLRDAAMLELMYATGIRVGELVALDVGDVDRERNVVRVFGKGRKERSVPFGHPAAHALDRWVASGRAALLADGAGAALFLGARGRRIDQRAVRTLVHRRIAEVPGRARHRPARTAAHGRHPPAGGRRRPACRPGDPRARVAGHHAALHPRHHRPAAPGLPAGAPAGLEPRRRAPQHVRRPGGEHRGVRLEDRAQGCGRHERARHDRQGLVAPERQQPDGAGADQAERVEVLLAALPAPVQARPGRAVRAGRLEACRSPHPGRPSCRGRGSPSPARRSCACRRGRRRPRRGRRARRRR